MRFFNLLELTVLAIAVGTKQVSAQCNITAVIDVPSETVPVEYSTVTGVGNVRALKKGSAKTPKMPKSSSGKKKGKVDLTNFSTECDDAAEITLDLPDLFSTTFKMDKRKKSPKSGKDESTASAMSTSNNVFMSGEDEGGSAINLLRKPNGNIVGSVTDLVHNTVMQIGEDMNGDTVIDIIPTSEFPLEAEPVLHNAIKDKPGEKKKRLLFNIPDDPNVSRSLNTDIVIIDVLVVWTNHAECKKATNSRGCTLNDNTRGKMNDLIALAIEESNVAFELSGVGIILELVHSYRGTFTEPATNAFSESLSNLRSSAEVHSKRVAFGADVVVMLIDDAEYCGMAYKGPAVNLMFSVTSWNCATGYYSFGHEIGHNLGLSHDRGTEDTCSGGYNYGYRDPDASFRTIMSYNCIAGQCDKNKGTSCSRVQRFSTSDTSIKYDYKALGTSAHDNARKLNEVKVEVSNYFTRPVLCSSAADCTEYDGIACYEAWCDDGTCRYNQNPVDGCCGDNKSLIKIDVFTDNYPQETAWNLQSESGNTIDAMTGTSEDTSLCSEHICVDFGQYIFTITDSWGDGICCGYGEGSISISVEGMNAPMVMSGAFKNEETQIFDVGFSTTTNPPSVIPSLLMRPSNAPSDLPSLSKGPSVSPSNKPSVSSKPSSVPSDLPSLSIYPSDIPSSVPSVSASPSSAPSTVPSLSMRPSNTPSDVPSLSKEPSGSPSNKPSISSNPSPKPSNAPSSSTRPSANPSASPSTSTNPSRVPTVAPSLSMRPSIVPSDIPSLSKEPSGSPSNIPSVSSNPSSKPSELPSLSMNPSVAPSDFPSVSNLPSEAPSTNPNQSLLPSESVAPSISAGPSDVPSSSISPSMVPSDRPSASILPSHVPSGLPSLSILPSAAPSNIPTASMNPSRAPSDVPSESANPSSAPSGLPSVSAIPSESPSAMPSVSAIPSGVPSLAPSVSTNPSAAPSIVPSLSTKPSVTPSNIPSNSAKPSTTPSGSPTLSIGPSSSPSDLPSNSAKPSTTPSGSPTLSIGPSLSPSDLPSSSVNPSSGPSGVPSLSLTPSAYPTDAPSVSTHPSATPSILPSNSQTPSLNPTELPSLSSVPSSQPSANPSYKPSVPPSEAPSGQPSPNPSYKPSVPPSETPSGQPSPYPSYKPSVPPSGAPSAFPSSSVSCEEEQHFDHTDKKGKTKPCSDLHKKITKECEKKPDQCKNKIEKNCDESQSSGKIDCPLGCQGLCIGF